MFTFRHPVRCQVRYVLALLRQLVGRSSSLGVRSVMEHCRKLGFEFGPRSNSACGWEDSTRSPSNAEAPGASNTSTGAIEGRYSIWTSSTTAFSTCSSPIVLLRRDPDQVVHKASSSPPASSFARPSRGPSTQRSRIKRVCAPSVFAPLRPPLPNHCTPVPPHSPRPELVE